MIVAYYVPSTTITGKSFKVLSNIRTSNYEIYGSTVTKDANGIESDIRFYIPNGAPISDFKLSLDANNVAKLEATFELLEGIFPDTKEKGILEIMPLE